MCLVLPHQLKLIHGSLHLKSIFFQQNRFSSLLIDQLETAPGGFVPLTSFFYRPSYDFGNQRFRKLTNFRVLYDRRAERAIAAPDQYFLFMLLYPGRAAKRLQSFNGIVQATLKIIPLFVWPMTRR